MPYNTWFCRHRHGQTVGFSTLLRSNRFLRRHFARPMEGDKLCCCPISSWDSTDNRDDDDDEDDVCGGLWCNGKSLPVLSLDISSSAFFCYGSRAHNTYYYLFNMINSAQNMLVLQCHNAIKNPFDLTWSKDLPSSFSSRQSITTTSSPSSCWWYCFISSYPRYLHISTSSPPVYRWRENIKSSLCNDDIRLLLQLCSFSPHGNEEAHRVVNKVLARPQST